MLVSEALLKLSYIDFVYDAESYPPDSSILAPLGAATDAEAGADSLVDDELADGKAMLTPDEILAKVHGGRAGHHGAKRTMALLNKHFPGHAISQALVEDYVASCWNCQKNRLPRAVFVEPIVRHIKPPGKRSALGIDTLTISPPDKHGNNYVIVLVNLYTKLCQLYPVKNKDELTTARAPSPCQIHKPRIHLFQKPGSPCVSAYPAERFLRRPCQSTQFRERTELELIKWAGGSHSEYTSLPNLHSFGK